MASRFCCTSVFSSVSDLFLPYGHVRVGISGGLETAIHPSRLLLDKYQTDPQCVFLNLVFLMSLIFAIIIGNCNVQ